MSSGVRRIVTGTRASGRSWVASDELLEPRNGAIELWQHGPGIDRDAVPFFPPPQASVFRTVDLSSSEDVTDIALQEKRAATLFDLLGAGQCRVDTRRDPWMHVTPTTDYVLVIAGVVDLLLDEGPPKRLYPGNIVIQRGTNHAWRSVGSDPARLLVVMTGTTETSGA